MLEFIDGNTAIVRGAIYAGCNFFAGYPITPATSILLEMIKELPKVKGTAIQAEDELAAIGFCIGAAMTGRKAMTATSGPGISLYSENIGLAIMGEVPLVIVDVQRMGPSTGGATKNSEGDIQFIRWVTSGGYPVIALCPIDVETCFSLTVKAFNFAEEYRTPVFIMSSKELGLTKDTVDLFLCYRIPIREREYARPEMAYLPYKFDKPHDIPLYSPFGGPHILRLTTSIHDERGILTDNPEKIERKLKHLDAKIKKATNNISITCLDRDKGADALIISYGMTARSAKEAVEIARKKGKKVSHLILYTLWPVPERDISSALEGVKRVIIPELNNGQYMNEISKFIGHRELIGIQRLDGSLISPSQILEETLMGFRLTKNDEN
jgi:2-oxoglutarate ferredoxin oxidoreductase subunit alpha